MSDYSWLLQRYEVDVSYPRIIGTDDVHIKKLNKRIKRLAIEKYQWPLHPSKKDLRSFKQRHPEAFNSIDLNYEVRLATDSFLSIYFIGYSYGIGAAHAVQYSFVINYDLDSGKELRLGDLFKPRSKYLEFISEYCLDELSKSMPHAANFTLKDELAPVAENYASWNVMNHGIRFNFDACKLSGCSEGKQKVEIPFNILQQRLNPKIIDRLASLR